MSIATIIAISLYLLGAFRSAADLFADLADPATGPRLRAFFTDGEPQVQAVLARFPWVLPASVVLTASLWPVIGVRALAKLAWAKIRSVD